MKTIIAFILVVIILFSCGNTNNSQSTGDTTTFYLVRHAEKDLTTSKNPHLTPQGEERAKNLSTYLKNIDAVYSTTYIRTQKTAYYTAKVNKVKVQAYQPNKLFNKAFLKKHKGENVLIVGHSNTIPQLVNKMTGENTRSDIPDDVYNRIYKVVFKNGIATASMREMD